MARKTVFSKLGPQAPNINHTSLAVKDGLREVRFNLRHGARKLARAVEDASQRHGEATSGPIELLGDLAFRTATTLLSNVDQAAVGLLSSDGPYRSMQVPLRPSASYFAASGACDLPTFTKDHHWRYRHWLNFLQRGDVFVHEQSIELAAEQIAEDLRCATADRGAQNQGEPQRLETTALIIKALTRHDIFSKPAMSTEESRCELVELAAPGAIVTVLSGEIVASQAGSTQRDQYANALRLADQVATADRERWEYALRSKRSTEELSAWLAFVLRHI